MVTAAKAKSVMTRWIEAANKKDLDTVMSLYAPEPELESPVVVELMQEPTGRLRGQNSLRSFFARALALPAVSFHLVDCAAGMSSLCARYINHKGTRSFTYMEFDANGKIRRHINHFME